MPPGGIGIGGVSDANNMGHKMAAVSSMGTTNTSMALQQQQHQGAMSAMPTGMSSRMGMAMASGSTQMTMGGMPRPTMHHAGAMSSQQMMMMGQQPQQQASMSNQHQRQVVDLNDLDHYSHKFMIIIISLLLMHY